MVIYSLSSRPSKRPLSHSSNSRITGSSTTEAPQASQVRPVPRRSKGVKTSRSSRIWTTCLRLLKITRPSRFVPGSTRLTPRLANWQWACHQTWGVRQTGAARQRTTSVRTSSTLSAMRLMLQAASTATKTPDKETTTRLRIRQLVPSVWSLMRFRETGRFLPTGEGLFTISWTKQPLSLRLILLTSRKKQIRQSREASPIFLNFPTRTSSSAGRCSGLRISRTKA